MARARFVIKTVGPLVTIRTTGVSGFFATECRNPDRWIATPSRRRMRPLATTPAPRRSKFR